MTARLMSIETLAIYLEASEGQVRKMVSERRLPPPTYNDKKFVRWDRKDIDAMLDSRQSFISSRASTCQQPKAADNDDQQTAGGLLVKAAQEALKQREELADP